MKQESTTMRRYEGNKDNNLFILNHLDKTLEKALPKDAHDQPTIWKYMSMEHARSMIEKNQLHLVKPSTWNDPYEKLFTSCIYQTPERKTYQELFKEPSEPYCTCFTCGFQNDAQWKMYNDKKKVDKGEEKDEAERKKERINQTTVLVGFNAFDLFKALSHCEQPCYIGGANYIPGPWSEVQKISDIDKLRICKQDKKTILGLLLRKRINYEYEKEVRLIHLQPLPRDKDVILEDHFELNVPNLSKAIKEIKVDSKASDDVFEKIKQELSAKGITARRSGLNKEVKKWKKIDLTNKNNK